MFASNSRYAGIETAEYVMRGGKTVKYLLRRFVPQPEQLVTAAEITVPGNTRLDNIAAAYIGDAEQFWRICDVNRAMRADDLEIPGQRLRIPLPDGITGLSNG